MDGEQVLTHRERMLAGQVELIVEIGVGQVVVRTVLDPEHRRIAGGDFDVGLIGAPLHVSGIALLRIAVVDGVGVGEVNSLIGDVRDFDELVSVGPADIGGVRIHLGDDQRDQRLLIPALVHGERDLRTFLRGDEPLVIGDDETVRHRALACERAGGDGERPHVVLDGAGEVRVDIVGIGVGLPLQRHRGDVLVTIGDGDLRLQRDGVGVIDDLRQFADIGDDGLAIGLDRPRFRLLSFDKRTRRGGVVSAERTDAIGVIGKVQRGVRRASAVITNGVGGAGGLPGQHKGTGAPVRHALAFGDGEQVDTVLQLRIDVGRILPEGIETGSEILPFQIGFELRKIVPQHDGRPRLDGHVQGGVGGRGFESLGGPVDPVVGQAQVADVHRLRAHVRQLDVFAGVHLGVDAADSVTGVDGKLGDDHRHAAGDGCACRCERRDTVRILRRFISIGADGGHAWHRSQRDAQGERRQTASAPR